MFTLRSRLRQGPGATIPNPHPPRGEPARRAIQLKHGGALRRPALTGRQFERRARANLRRADGNELELPRLVGVAVALLVPLVEALRQVGPERHRELERLAAVAEVGFSLSSGVRITTVAPGVTSTGFSEVAGSHYPERLFPHLQARRVVEAALRAHERGRAVKVVGAFYFFLTIADRFMPRFAVRRLMGRLWRPPPTPKQGSPGTARSLDQPARS